MQWMPRVAAGRCVWGVVSLASSGIGGGAFMLLRLANGDAQAFDMRETAPFSSSMKPSISNPIGWATKGIGGVPVRGLNERDGQEGKGESDDEEGAEKEKLKKKAAMMIIIR
ncbi:hypothetical protein J5N97_017103 [Dioscorea zingiberensis]|uniref:Uncharacterized protein n=1 Tax=Dioscorea zingiberensis TaxID=325984 RepID=A0A9D5HG89_9LILI|nr:hypothetical protein J5N97_017103 [Dioscorea zingiberensis]